MKYFKFFMEKNTEDKPVKVNSKLKKFLYSNKITFNLLMKFRDRITKKAFKRKLEEFKKQGKDIIVIDDWMLTTHKDLCSKCKKIYVLGRKFTQRRVGLKERDNATLEELKIIDIPFALGFIQMPNGANVERIDNSGSLEDLSSLVNEKYQELGILGFDEKYQIKDKSVIDRLMQISRGANGVNKLLHRVGKTLEKENKY